MIKYEVGKRFPLEKYLNRGEITIAVMNEMFFDVLCCIDSPSADEVKEFRRGKLNLYLYENSNIPFVICELPDIDFSFDVSIDLLKIDAEHQDNWLNGKGNVLYMHLVDSRTGILTAMRTISLPLNFSEKIRDISEIQLQEEIEVASKIAEILNKTPTTIMMKNSVLKLKIK